VGGGGRNDPILPEGVAVTGVFSWMVYLLLSVQLDNVVVTGVFCWTVAILDSGAVTVRSVGWCGCYSLLCWTGWQLLLIHGGNWIPSSLAVLHLTFSLGI
jgi:hypothetical protein